MIGPLVVPTKTVSPLGMLVTPYASCGSGVADAVLTVASVVVSPPPTAVTRPADETVAAPGSLDDQVNAAFLCTPPWISCAENCCVPPTSSVTSLGLTTTTRSASARAPAMPVGSGWWLHASSVRQTVATGIQARGLMSRSSVRGKRLVMLDHG